MCIYKQADECKRQTSIDDLAKGRKDEVRMEEDMNTEWKAGNVIYLSNKV